MSYFRSGVFRSSILCLAYISLCHIRWTRKNLYQPSRCARLAQPRGQAQDFKENFLKTNREHILLGPLQRSRIRVERLLSIHSDFRKLEPIYYISAYELSVRTYLLRGPGTLQSTYSIIKSQKGSNLLHFYVDRYKTLKNSLARKI